MFLYFISFYLKFESDWYGKSYVLIIKGFEHHFAKSRNLKNQYRALQRKLNGKILLGLPTKVHRASMEMRLAGLHLQLKRVALEQNTRLAVSSRASDN
jgi:hypothetical protein